MKEKLNSYNRIKKALEHKEADRVPLGFDAHAAGIHKIAYQNLRGYLNLPLKEIKICSIVAQLAELDKDFLAKIDNDIKGVFSDSPSSWELSISEAKDYKIFTDEFGIFWRMPSKNGLYFDMFKHPWQDINNIEEIKNYDFHDPEDEGRFTGFRDDIIWSESNDMANIIHPNTGGIFELSWWLRGFNKFMLDLAGNIKIAQAILNKVLEYKIKYWKKVVDIAGNKLFIIAEGDDLAYQNGLMISPEMYRKLIKPLHKKLFSFIKGYSKSKVYIYYHGCGAIKKLIPDLIETGVDILNPVQLSAKDMKAEELKKDFGDMITFWGGGINTQKTLPFKKPDDIIDETKRNIDNLAPGGGFVFAPEHNVQADVPPENFMAMWQAFKDYGSY